MSYQVVVPEPVQKQLDELPDEVCSRLLEKILKLRDNPRPVGCVKLRNYKNEYRIRMGDYRIRYEIYDEGLMWY